MNSNFVIVHSDDLYHHGILGQKWGIRRFQPYPKGSSSKGKFVGKIKGSIKKTASSTKNVISKSINRGQEKKKQKIIRSGDREKVLKYSRKLSDAELRSALDRIRLNEAIKNKPIKQQTEVKNIGKKRVNSVLRYAKNANTALSEGIKLYQNVTTAKKILKDIKKARSKV